MSECKCRDRCQCGTEECECEKDQEFLEKHKEQKNKIDILESSSDYMIRIGRYVFKLKDIHYLSIDPLDKANPDNKDYLDQGADTQLVVKTEHGTFLALLTNQQSILNVCDKICNLVHELILTKR